MNRKWFLICGAVAIFVIAGLVFRGLTDPPRQPPPTTSITTDRGGKTAAVDHRKHISDEPAEELTEQGAGDSPAKAPLDLEQLFASVTVPTNGTIARQSFDGPIRSAAHRIFWGLDARLRLSPAQQKAAAELLLIHDFKSWEQIDPAVLSAWADKVLSADQRSVFDAYVEELQNLKSYLQAWGTNEAYLDLLDASPAVRNEFNQLLLDGYSMPKSGVLNSNEGIDDAVARLTGALEPLKEIFSAEDFQRLADEMIGEIRREHAKGKAFEEMLKGFDSSATEKDAYDALAKASASAEAAELARNLHLDESQGRELSAYMQDQLILTEQLFTDDKHAEWLRARLDEDQSTGLTDAIEARKLWQENENGRQAELQLTTQFVEFAKRTPLSPDQDEEIRQLLADGNDLHLNAHEYLRRGSSPDQPLRAQIEADLSWLRQTLNADQFDSYINHAVSEVELLKLLPD